MRKAFLVVLAILFLTTTIAPCFAADAAKGDPGRKLGRGAINTILGFWEVPKTMYSVTKEKNIFVGLTWGLIKGVAMGLVRTAVGLYDVITFPIPYPEDYKPVIEPEYVFP
jgi:putative exosortase-associated protein (TIGR04073 family)